MFTGIIRKLSTVEKVAFKKGSLFLEISRPKSWKIWEGESISINGICSTIKRVNTKIFEVEYMPETIKKTTAGEWKKGTEVNLEKSLKMNDLLDGHIVQGHIDTRGKIINIKKDKESKVMKIQIPQKFMRLVADKGSVSVDGISLTVVDTGYDWFSISLVSYTLENTNLGKIKIGEEVNIETDVLAKYLDKLLRSQNYAKKK
ncbi:MAG TPA: riboflavin synthase [Candidatus Moranbacteria bacterium]|nr:riboflavin synthase [Candidatus Moranbacteria bacterium]